MYLARETAIKQVNQLVAAHGDRPCMNEQPHLTEHEIEILRHIANGETYGQIGKALGISTQAVKNTMTLIMPQLGARNKAHAVALALRYGLLSLNEVMPDQTVKQPDAAKKPSREN